jgi:sec-independent protein translocase protein TatA
VFDAIFQPAHLILILAVALLVLGPKRLPAAGRTLGQGLREFKGSITGDESEDQ